jgi:hypothetical protein
MIKHNAQQLKLLFDFFIGFFGCLYSPKRFSLFWKRVKQNLYTVMYKIVPMFLHDKSVKTDEIPQIYSFITARDLHFIYFITNKHWERLVSEELCIIDLLSNNRIKPPLPFPVLSVSWLWNHQIFGFLDNNKNIEMLSKLSETWTQSPIMFS